KGRASIQRPDRALAPDDAQLTRIPQHAGRHRLSHAQRAAAVMVGAAPAPATAEVHDMNDFLKVDLGGLGAHRPPAMLLDGINLVRALGIAGIPVIVASDERFTPAMASRYAIGRCALPPAAQREAVAERLLRAGEILTGAL